MNIERPPSGKSGASEGSRERPESLNEEAADLDRKIEAERESLEIRAEQISEAIENVDETQLNEQERGWFDGTRKIWGKAKGLVKENADLAVASSVLGASSAWIIYAGTELAGASEGRASMSQ